MGKIKILADSTCDLSMELISKYQITIIPLNIILDMKSYLDGIEISPEILYQWSDKTHKTPKTAAPELGYVMEVLRKIKEDGDEFIFIGISEDMSVTCQTIRMAAEELEFENVYVINSKNLSTGIGLQVIRAAELVEQGFSADKIVEDIEQFRERVKASFVVDTLTYLHRGGRCSSVAALVGNVLKLKPMIEVNNGKMGVGRKYRGKLKNVILDYTKDINLELEHADPSRIFITHSGIDKAIEQEVFEYLSNLNYFQEVLITRAGGVISSHCGPNTLGILYVK